MIIEEVLRLAVDKEYLQSILEKDTAPKVDETELFRERLVEVKKQMDKLLNLYQIGAVDISDMAGRLESLKEEKEALQHNICLLYTSLPSRPVLVLVSFSWLIPIRIL